MSKTLSDKQFIRKASGRVSAIGFLDAYEEHIRSNYPGAHPAMDAFKNGQMLPTPALEYVKKVVGQHILQGMVNRAEETIQKDKPKKRFIPKNGITGQGKYSVQFFVKNTHERTLETKIEVWTDDNGYHTFKAETWQAALRIADRKHVDILHGQYATISQEVSEGRFLTTRVDRDDSMARMLRPGRGPVCKVKPTSAPLKNLMHCKNDTCSFSRG